MKSGARTCDSRVVFNYGTLEHMEEKKTITVTYPDGKVASAVLNLVVRKKPLGWSRRSFATYYKEKYALWMKEIADEMISSRKPKVFDLQHWPNTTMNGLYLRINQSLLYLLEPSNGMDNEGVYKKFRESIKIHRVKGVGVSINFEDESYTGGAASGHKGEEYVLPKEIPKWKKKIDEYLETDNPTGEPLHISGLLLTNEQIEQIELELYGISNVQFSVSHREIRIIKGI